MSNIYIRKVMSVDPKCQPIDTDLYRIFDAYGVRSAPLAHAIKKLMLPGQRGVKDMIQDMTEAIESIHQAIQIERQRS